MGVEEHRLDLGACRRQRASTAGRAVVANAGSAIRGTSCNASPAGSPVAEETRVCGPSSAFAYHGPTFFRPGVLAARARASATDLHDHVEFFVQPRSRAPRPAARCCRLRSQKHGRGVRSTHPSRSGEFFCDGAQLAQRGRRRARRSHRQRIRHAPGSCAGLEPEEKSVCGREPLPKFNKEPARSSMEPLGQEESHPTHLAHLPHTQCATHPKHLTWRTQRTTCRT